jgi:phage-related protein (TIGR01555 family)
MTSTESFARRAARQATSQAVKVGSEIRTRMDGWFNTLTGLGTTRDKRMAGQFQAGMVLTAEECESLFHHDDLANTIISAVPNDALRQGFKVKRSTEEEEGADAAVGEVQEDAVTLDKALRALCVVEKLREAMIWGRCMGGGFILLGVKGSGRPEMPLVDEMVKAVDFLTVLDRRDLTPATYYQNPLEPKYGEVETYYLNPMSQGALPSFMAQVRVHESRLIRFGGAMTSRRAKQQNGGWDHSVLQKLVDKLRDVNSNWDSVVTMFQDMSQAVYKLQGLIDAIAEGDSVALEERMALVDSLRSITKAIILDAEAEDFKLVERGTMNGVGDLLDRSWIRLSAAARMPVTILMGQAPAGLNATGAIDLRWWYDTVRTAQEVEIKPPALRIVRLVAQSLFPAMDPESWELEFPSLWMLTPQEAADLRGKVADTDTKYIQAGVVLPEEITLSRFGRGEYSTEYVVDLEARKTALETELDRLADPPPPPPGQFPGAPPAPGSPEDPEDPEEGPEDPEEGLE